MKYFIHENPAVIVFTEQHRIGAEITLREDGLDFFVHDVSVKEDFSNFISSLLSGNAQVPNFEITEGSPAVSVNRIPLDEHIGLRQIAEAMQAQGYPVTYASTPLRNILHFVCPQLSSEQLAENLGTYLSLTVEEEIELLDEMKRIHSVLESRRPAMPF